MLIITVVMNQEDVPLLCELSICYVSIPAGVCKFQQQFEQLLVLKKQVAQLETEQIKKEGALDVLSAECAELRRVANLPKTPSMVQYHALSQQVQMLFPYCYPCNLDHFSAGGI